MRNRTWRAKRQEFFHYCPRKSPVWIFSAFCLILLTGCSNAGKPTSTPTPRPTPTFIPIDMAPPVPQGTPVDEWHHIPVMPGATSGSGDELGYSYAIQASAEEVQAFYKDHMPKLGWEYDASSGSDADMPLMVFKKGSYIVTVSYFPHGVELVVLLVR